MALHHDRKARVKRTRSGLDTGADTLTEQHHKDSCDATQIVQRYAQTGVLTHVKNIPGAFVDLPDQIDYQQALEAVQKGREAFHTLPATLRETFAHSPQRFLEALHDPSHQTFFEQHGILAKRMATQTPAGETIVETQPPATP